ncbi:hypothetical protein BJX68DRAFT_276824 [Aspergillus pseudodeflectus]|uniref:Saponin hydrolase n=1 Tax=Aspergillus pseudodeflectus TaxID=176178 RepID=A0ABR4L598_9EURO
MRASRLATALVLLLDSIAEASGSHGHGTCRLPGAPHLRPPPPEEPISIVELPLPPSIVDDSVGACTDSINPRRTGCIKIVLGDDDSLPQGGTFTPDGTAIVATVNYTGAPAEPHPASIYSGVQTILIKTDNTTFPNGDSWKCITCGVPLANQLGTDRELQDYPRVFKDGKRFLVGTNIIYTGGYRVDSALVTPNNTYIYPIYWPTTADGSGPSGPMRELRLHPDDTHLSWSSFAGSDQNGFYGRLTFKSAPTTGEPRVPRYDLSSVNLIRPKNGKRLLTGKRNRQLTLDFSALEVGELRGFSGSGNELLYIGYPWESCNFDAFAVNIRTGAVRRLTAHPEYVDPVDMSPDDRWTIVLDTRASTRNMFLAGMRGIPPISDLVTSSVCASVRNNGYRRFFQPILIDQYGDRGSYFGQIINAAGDGTNGAINDPNWNARADPQFSLDGTRIMYYQTIVKSPACGGANPLPCPVSNAPDGRTTRIMLATLTSRTPSPVPKYRMGPDRIPWAIPYTPGMAIPARDTTLSGTYTYKGKFCGSADVSIISAANSTVPSHVRVEFHNLSDDGESTLNGYEDISVTALDTWVVQNDWYSDIVQTGKVNGTKRTGPGGFHVVMDVTKNYFNATGELATVLDGEVFVQPGNFM